jgi:hypothetical protein
MSSPVNTQIILIRPRIPVLLGRLAHLYVLCKGGNGEVGGSRRNNQSVGKDKIKGDVGGISPHLCQNRKGGPATQDSRGPDWHPDFSYSR